MKCAKCQHPMQFREWVCRRCLYCPELDTYISIDVPRSGGDRVARIGISRHLRERIFIQSSWARKQYGLAPWILLLASLVPGAGHILSGRKMEGIITFAVISGLITYCLFSDIQSSSAMPLMGIAFGLHIMSLLRMTSSLDYGFAQRMVLNLIFFVVLGVLVYDPLADLMLVYKPEMYYVTTYNGMPTFEGWGGMFSLTFMVMVVVVAVVTSKVLSFVFSLRESKRT